MTTKQLQKYQKQLENLYKKIQDKKILKTINQIVDIELLLEQESNK